ncbi:hypothetical protein VCRA213O314_120103 [Vibrio crassostreae]|nr:hypothetical protein VCRA213O314_120103 [Vibrio crassostreae]
MFLKTFDLDSLLAKQCVLIYINTLIRDEEELCVTNAITVPKELVFYNFQKK